MFIQEDDFGFIFPQDNPNYVDDLIGIYLKHQKYFISLIIGQLFLEIFFAFVCILTRKKTIEQVYYLFFIPINL